MPEERIQKVLARTGLGSRRSCEALIEAGRVSVNGNTAKLGMKADITKDRILVDGEPIVSVEPMIYIALNKPRGVLSTVKSQFSRKTVRDLVDIPERIYPVGRLDSDSEGLILLTNDGELTNILTHPRYNHEKEYRVLVAKHPDEEQLTTWRNGVILKDGYRTSHSNVSIEGYSGKGAWLRVILREGRKRQIREIGELIGLPVVRIERIRIGNLKLGSLRSGQWRHLTEQEIYKLKGIYNQVEKKSRNKYR